MTSIPNAAQKIPMMFRAQIEGRCQLQRIQKDQDSDAVRWIEEWVERTYPDTPDLAGDGQTRTYAITWRFVSNGGQDDTIIRPAIGARGWPFYPGSSMKGVFRRACTPEQADRYCGKELPGSDFQPGILRFQGGYPTTTDWTESLIDIVHPQQDWQVKSNTKSVGAFTQISLYEPELRFGISSTIPLNDAEWEEIWGIWEKAISTGIGCRVCAGYGQPETHIGNVLYRTNVQGQGQAAKLLDGTGEFRPNVFRAAIRGHALRLFGGLTDEANADRMVNELFGTTTGKGTVGLLGMGFRTSDLVLETFGKGSYTQPTYEVSGELTWLLTQELASPEEREALTKLIVALTRFAMVFGGFGKSWRRADHRLFYPDYYDEGYKPLIGCHWQWNGERSLRNDSQVRKLEDIGPFIHQVRQIATQWMTLRKIPTAAQPTPWRETWHPSKVQVWGRLASEAEDSEAIHWLHGPYREAIPQARIREGSIYRSSVTGQVGQIGRLWHRLYPVVILRKNPDNPKKPIPRQTSQFLELLTLFPDDSTEAIDFLNFLETQQKSFVKLWPSS
ncbi:MAG: hypothetical protein SFW36_09790 [Leptolyngbyaceae cyanobacterium bins.59]|nr:hypothetical protein [Leptolyngbyaceae cyanobacterium bins.59]